METFREKLERIKEVWPEEPAYNSYSGVNNTNTAGSEENNITSTELESENTVKEEKKKKKKRFFFF